MGRPKSSEEMLLQKIHEDLKKLSGGCGTQVITGTAQVTGNWYALVATGGNATLDVSGCSSSIDNFPTGSDDMIIFNGVTLLGGFTAIQLSSGTVTAYIKC